MGIGLIRAVNGERGHSEIQRKEKKRRKPDDDPRPAGTEQRLRKDDEKSQEDGSEEVNTDVRNPQRDPQDMRQAPPDRGVSWRQIREKETDRQHGQSQGTASGRGFEGPAESDEEGDRKKHKRGELPTRDDEIAPALKRSGALSLNSELQSAAAAFDVESVGTMGFQIRPEYSSRSAGVLMDVSPLQGQDDVPGLETGALGRRVRDDGLNDAAPFFDLCGIAELQRPKDTAVCLKEKITQEESGDNKQPQWNLVRSFQCLNPDSLAA